MKWIIRWIVADFGGVCYYVGGNAWSTDSSKAMRFSRFEAKRMARKLQAADRFGDRYCALKRG